MRIVDVKIDWMLRYGNAPRITIVVDRWQPAYRYQSVSLDDGTFYFARDGAVVNFMHHNPRDQSGFGGHEFTLQMLDGSHRKVKGPWSSSTADFNSIAGEPHVASVTVYLVGERYPHCAGFITVDAINQALAEFVDPAIQLCAARVAPHLQGSLRLDDVQDRVLAPPPSGGPGDRVTYQLNKADREKLVIRCDRCGAESFLSEDYERRRYAFAVQHRHELAAQPAVVG